MQLHCQDRGKARRTQQRVFEPVRGVYVAFYRSDKDFLGNDSVVLEVRYPSGKQEIQHIVITVRGPGAGQPT